MISFLNRRVLRSRVLPPRICPFLLQSTTDRFSIVTHALTQNASWVHEFGSFNRRATYIFCVCQFHPIIIDWNLERVGHHACIIGELHSCVTLVPELAANRFENRHRIQKLVCEQSQKTAKIWPNRTASGATYGCLKCALSGSRDVPGGFGRGLMRLGARGRDHVMNPGVRRALASSL